VGGGGPPAGSSALLSRWRLLFRSRCRFETESAESNSTERALEVTTSGAERSRVLVEHARVGCLCARRGIHDLLAESLLGRRPCRGCVRGRSSRSRCRGFPKSHRNHRRQIARHREAGAHGKEECARVAPCTQRVSKAGPSPPSRFVRGGAGRATAFACVGQSACPRAAFRGRSFPSRSCRRTPVRLSVVSGSPRRR